MIYITDCIKTYIYEIYRDIYREIYRDIYIMCIAIYTYMCIWGATWDRTIKCYFLHGDFVLL